MSLPSRTGLPPDVGRGAPPHANSRPADFKPSKHTWDEFLARDGWEAWQAHLASRRSPRPVLGLVRVGKTPPLLWSVPERCGPQVVRWLEAASQLPKGGKAAAVALAPALMHALAEPSPTNDPVAFGLTRLAWAHACPHVAITMDSGAWVDLLHGLLAAVEDAAAIPLEDEPLGRLLLGGELPWTLAYLFPELNACRRLASGAEALLARGLLDLLDGEGVLAAQHLPHWRPLLALWSRCGLLGRAMDRDCYAGEAEEQYAWLVQRAVLWSRPDGGQLLAAGAAGAWCEELFEAALALAADADDAALARAVLPLGANKATVRGRVALRPESRRAAAKLARTTAAAFHSEWAEAALLRSAATRESPRLAVAFGQRRLQAELTNRDAVVFSGAWDPQIDVDGCRLAPEGDWEEVCWVSDADLDYLELEISLAAGWRLQRQLLLARKEDFLFAGDAVLGPAPGAIEYRCAAPLTRGVTFAGEAETRDGVLGGKKKLAVVLPLALPEWRIERHRGSLEATATGLELAIAASGRALFAPLFLDLSQRRFKKPRTWRRLTVAERLEIQPPDVAVGFRVQVGGEQWLFYRSLAKAANRTVLGQNLASEFVAARFTPKGFAEEMVSITSE